MAYTTRVLVVASQTADSPDLQQALRERAERGPVEVTLLLPATEGGHGGKVAAAERVAQVLAAWREAGLEATGEPGSNDPFEAVVEIWQPGRFDEVIVSTLPGSSSRWLRSDLPHRIARHTDAQVTHVIAKPPGWHHPQGHAPERRESNPLGPLAVLSWGGRRQD